jgi:hypothetical protein
MQHTFVECTTWNELAGEMVAGTFLVVVSLITLLASTSSMSSSEEILAFFLAGPAVGLSFVLDFNMRPF